jgi:hypothetical protein
MSLASATQVVKTCRFGDADVTALQGANFGNAASSFAAFVVPPGRGHEHPAQHNRLPRSSDERHAERRRHGHRPHVAEQRPPPRALRMRLLAQSRLQLEIHGEWARIPRLDHPIIGPNGQASLQGDSVTRPLLGPHDLTKNEITIIAEY